MSEETKNAPQEANEETKQNQPPVQNQGLAVSYAPQENQTPGANDPAPTIERWRSFFASTNFKD